jgi:hypothetical protein
MAATGDDPSASLGPFVVDTRTAHVKAVERLQPMKTVRSGCGVPVDL